MRVLEAEETGSEDETQVVGSTHSTSKHTFFEIFKADLKIALTIIGRAVAMFGFYFAFFSIQPCVKPGESGISPVVLSFSRDPLPEPWFITVIPL